MTESTYLPTNTFQNREEILFLSERYDEYIKIIHENQLLTRNIIMLDRGLYLEEVEEYPDNYKLSIGINYQLWERIGAYMHKIPRYLDGNNLSPGWQVIKGKEKEVERLLEIPVKQSIDCRNERYDLFILNKRKLSEYRLYFFQRLEIIFRTHGIIVTDKVIKRSLFPSNQTESNIKSTFFFPGTSWKSVVKRWGKWWVIDKSDRDDMKIWMVMNTNLNYQNNGNVKEFNVPDLIVFIEYSEVIEWIITILGKSISKENNFEKSYDEFMVIEF